MKISVIIPSYNRADLICYSLDSLVEGSSGELEIIVVDDGSTDNTEEIVKLNYPIVRYLKQENSGAPTARNLGLKESNGDFVLFLDSDDFLEKNFFDSREQAFKINPSLDGVYGNFDFFESIGDYLSKDEVPRFSRYPLYDIGNEDKILNNLLGGWYIHPCSILWRKSFLQKLGGFKLDLLINQDVDLIFRAIMSGAKLTGVKGPRAMIREHKNERVGAIDKSPAKINQIHQLRLWFKEEMIKKNIWNETYADSLANYCFGIWEIYRKTMPMEANKFLQFSRLLKPNLELKGGLVLRFLSKILGNERAVAFRQAWPF